MKGISTITVSKETRMLFQSTKRRLSFKNADELASLFLKMRAKNSWSKLDCEIIANFGIQKFLELENSIITVSAPNDAEAMEKLNLTKAKKITEKYPVADLKIVKKEKQP